MKESFGGIWGRKAPVFPLLLLESLDETEVAGKLQVCLSRDRAGRLKCSYFIARVVVLFFKLPESLWIADKTDKVNKIQAAKRQL